MPRYGFWIALAVLTGAILRVVFMTGLVGGFPQDDAIYVQIARNLVSGDLGLDGYHNLPRTYVADPGEWFIFRVAFTYPLALMFYFFGEGDRVATLVPIAASLTNILMAAKIGRIGFGSAAAVFAAWLMATMPIDIVISTRVLADVPFGTLITAGFLCVLLGYSRNKDSWWLTAGFCFAAAYLTKILAICVVGAFLPIFIWMAYDARRLRWLALLSVGFVFVILIEGVIYLQLTGRFFLHFFVANSAADNKFVTGDMHWTPLFQGVRAISEGYFVTYTPILLGWGRIPPFELIAGCAPQFWLASIGIAGALVRRSKVGLAIAAALVALYVLLEFGPVNLSRRDGVLELVLLPRQERFITWLGPLAAVMGGYFFSRIWEYRRKGQIAAIVGLSAIIGIGWPALRDNHALWRDSLADMRLTAQVIQTLKVPVYIDHWGQHILLRYFASDTNSDQFHAFDNHPTPESLERGIIVLGGGRGNELMSQVILDALPPWVRAITLGEQSPPANWVLLTTREAKLDDCRVRNLMIYFVDNTTAATDSPSDIEQAEEVGAQ